MADKNYYSKKKKIKGVEYTALFSGLSNALKALDGIYVADKSDNISIYKLSEYIFSNVIVNPPHLTADDFEDFETFKEVVNFGQSVMMGNFRESDAATVKDEGAK